MKHASRTDCPCCHTCLGPGSDTDRALVASFLAGVYAVKFDALQASIFCAYHWGLVRSCNGFVNEHWKKDN